MIQTTTALRKIASLKKPIKVVQGGQGASKTFSIVTLLINHASSKPNKEIIILSAELTKMRLTVIKDFVNIMRSFGIYEDSRFIAGTLYRFRNGSFIKFIGLDKSDVGKGLRSDIAYFNEVNKIDVETYRQVASRADKVYADFNPDAEFFIHTDVIPRDDCDFLKLTFEDNEALRQRERDEILLYKKLGYNEQGEIINKYWANKWRVYGLGEIGSIDGVVFERWDVIEQLPPNARLIYYGVDFGFTTSKFACVAVYKLDGVFIFDEVVYKNNLTNVEAVPFIKNYGYKGELLYCDYAEPKSIQELNNNGLNAVKCESKNDIHKFAIQKLNEQPFLVTKRSENLINELRYYVYDEKTGKPKKSDKDHLMDALTYAVGSGDKYTGHYAVG
jgi:phage terminase large subunit